jgi:hypothetical protein
MTKKPVKARSPKHSQVAKLAIEIDVLKRELARVREVLDVVYRDAQIQLQQFIADRKALREYFVERDAIAKKIEYETSQSEFQQAESAVARTRYRYRMASDAMRSPMKDWPSNPKLLDR